MKKIPIEVIVFGIIAVFIIIVAILVSIPAKTELADLENLGKAPELTGTQGWINSEPLKIEQLKGKVVLVDFWTYSCINCIRTLPYLNEWHSKYGDKGLVIIGVHTPEFEFEKNLDNVKTAVEKYGIKYAVVQDNDYATWRAFENNYWPRKYLIDKEGNIRYDHIGEGSYKETEQAIQQLLLEINASLDMNKTIIEQNINFSQIGTPELYLGYAFARAPLGNNEGFKPSQVVNYAVTTISEPNIVYLEGRWFNGRDGVISVDNARMFLVYKAKNVNIVAGGRTTIQVFLDGKELTESTRGDDVIPASSSVIIDENRLYNIISTPDYETHILTIVAEEGFELYTFTFG